MSTDPAPIRVAIVGAGIAGLTLAISLSRFVPEVKVDIYEQVQEIKEIGAGILFWPRTWEILKTLGLDVALAEHLPVDRKPTNERTLVWRVMKSDQEVGEDIFELYHMGGASVFHRAVVQKTLLAAIPPNVKIHLGHRLTSYDESPDSVQLNFDNLPSQTCELLVAADGIKSSIRKEFIEKRVPQNRDMIDPVWGGMVAYRSLISTERIRERFPNHPSLFKSVIYTGKGKSTITYPIMQGKFINVVVLDTDHSKAGTKYDGPATKLVDKEFVFKRFEGWSEEYLSLLKSMETISAWAIQYSAGLERFAEGRVLLMGDAAHAMPPTLGSGAGQAVEDAYILSHLLSKSLKHQIPMHRVTEAYAKNRQPLANLVLNRSHDMGRIANWTTPGFEGFDEADKETRDVMLKKYIEEFEGMFSWWKEYPVEREVEKALEML